MTNLNYSIFFSGTNASFAETGLHFSLNSAKSLRSSSPALPDLNDIVIQTSFEVRIGYEFIRDIAITKGILSSRICCIITSDANMAGNPDKNDRKSTLVTSADRKSTLVKSVDRKSTLVKSADRKSTLVTSADRIRNSTHLISADRRISRSSTLVPSVMLMLHAYIFC